MTTLYDCSDQEELLTGMRLARQAIGRGELVVLPTDTVYGVAADAFSADAVRRLLEAKGRGRESPPPVLVPGTEQLEALADEVPQAVHDLVAEFWPGGLTIVLRARPSLDWDLGDTRGTVGIRMPSDRIALEILRETGPLAVSSANLTGQPAATTAEEAHRMLGDAVAVYLDGGPAGIAYQASGAEEGTASTIVDATELGREDGRLRFLRHGVIPDEEIVRVVGADRCA